ncbi:hypothetical protein [Rivularia sp. UHCC 0363]|uniref:hypothetical protein n=1 Tax=Rivularia sp. UHCC 0363 TaxID=3110244 RepID=UPI002B1F59F4|nr:hypothetical protein [Rivularia sp. UHCC 0363]MEA5593497.1 hypothetical protein [Rivularia sp. UHCC 0363]
MYRLHNNAFEILSAEIEICKSKDKQGKQNQQIVLKRLEQLRLKVGKPAKLNELRAAVVDVFPIFSETALKEAAKSNRKPSIFHKFKYVAIAFASAAGVLTIINLPYPNIRWSVARTAPILLIPSYLSMDFHYWGAKNSAQQAENLLISAENFTDIQQVEHKTEDAQKHLSSIPVWFLGYYPEVYCEKFNCSWNFNFNDFKKIRTQLTLVETEVFREKQAFIPLIEAEQVYNSAKIELTIAKTQKQKELAIASIEATINTIENIPPETLASKKSEAKLKVYKHYFQTIAQKK